MKRMILLLLLVFPLMLGHANAPVYAEPYETYGDDEQTNTIQPYKRGGYRSPSRSYNPGVGTPTRTTPTRPDTARTPVTTTPRTGFGGFWGGMFGGLAFGTILGSLFNPMAGFTLGTPILSLLSIAIWVVLIVVVVRFIRRARNKGY
ncbi:hypothetical protein [Paenibacillus sp. HJGM_3]|uniref:hypothetical protein n=1 Tax=Paenibacillus sp. HJGM_3 TaxID=3379816 RepID=UPI00385BBC10